MFRTPPNDGKGRSCSQCDGEDTMEMVQCDQCDQWYHFKCAGVNQSVENHKWMCAKCKDADMSNVDVARIPAKSTYSVKSGVCSRKSKVGNANRTQKANPIMKSLASSKTSKCDLELQQLEEEHAIEKKFLKKKFEILARSEKQSLGSSRSEVSHSLRTRQWVADIPVEPTKRIPCQKLDTELPFEEVVHGVAGLTKSNIAARQALSRELPSFSGNPNEWSVFYSSYIESTNLCGYSNSENLLRLQKALKGKAYDLVNSLLLLSKNVPEVIKTLKMMFGRPEIIINTLLEQLRSEPSPKAEKLDSLIAYAVSVRNLCSTMEASRLTSHIKNPLLLQELVDKLPAQMKLNWSLHSGEVEADIIKFSEWLFTLAEAATRVSNTCLPKKPSANLHTHDVEKTLTIRAKCVLCDKIHSLQGCDKFAKLKLHERWDLVKTHKLCRICLKKHGQFRCSDSRCSVDGCEARHHKLLHRFVPTSATVTTHSSLSKAMLKGRTYFKVIPVVLHHNGRSLEVFALLDDGSNVTLMDEDICEELGLKGERDTLCLKWTSGAKREERNSMNVSLMVSKIGQEDKQFELNHVQTVENLSLPTQTLNMSELRCFKHLKNIPMTAYSNASPKLLIGLNNGYLTNTLKMIEGNPNEPCASKTRIGWVIHGGGSNLSEAQNDNHVHLCECNGELGKLQDLMSDYFSLESTGKPYDLKSSDEERANHILEMTTKRVGGRFETGLLWRSDNHDVPCSFRMAFKRLQCIERKLDTDQTVIVTEKIEDLVNKGYARKLSPKEIEDIEPVTWYLPIFIVTNPNKPNKVRLVWDAAAKVNGISLNSMLLKGPDLMAPMLSVLYGFRLHRVAICADIKEMFHRIMIRKEDQNAQRFLWRNCESTRDPDVYVMNVMTFGAACSPSSAQFVKNKNAKEFEDRYPRAVKCIIGQHYVDDLLDCAESEEEAIQLARQVSIIHDQGGFYIRNWRSNSADVMQNLADLEENYSSTDNVNIELSAEKVLGMWWVTATDEFTFSLKLNRLNTDVLSGIKKPNKLDILRTLMSIFDPFGFLSPFVVYLKILLQEVWRTTEGWSTCVDELIFRKWIVWVRMLPKIESIKIPRWYNITAGSVVQLHIFVDASERAYAAVAYLRIECNGEFTCKLVGSKSKVAPKQPLSIPRMELMAAVLGSRLATSVDRTHSLKFERRWFWSDSNTVLSWINSDARNYKQFVMFRIGEILENTTPVEWRFVPTKLNVADDATKWKGAAALDVRNRWYQGPEFLTQDETAWPNKTEKPKECKDELRPHATLLHVNELVMRDANLVELERFSKWERLLNTAIILFKFRSVTTCQKASHSSLLYKAENLVYSLIQSQSFKDEVASLRQGQSISRTSSLYKCSAYLDENSVMRMRGRIDLACVDESTKRPIILPRDHHGTHLVIQHYHQKFHHVHHDTCLNELRQKFYIPRLRTELKKVRSKCQHCKNSTSMPVVPEMAGLPSARLAPFVRPFSYVGIDYFGPLYVNVARHKEKRWGVLFTCLTVRAIHIEISRELSTDCCIMVIQNFIARRGTPIEIYSDNGTNFKGADNELKKAATEIDYTQLEIKFASSKTKWCFNPPAAPHMGGCWERLIQSVKKILYKICPQFSFRDDTLLNALLECERVVNSRPITYIDLETSSDEALTPNHFLLGSSNGQKQLGEFSEHDCSLRKNWRKSQYFANLFWKRWVQEYLPTLTKRTRWFKQERCLAVDDIVVVVDPNLPRNNWPLGKIVTIHKGKDGNVRSAIVQTKDGLLTRPTAKLARLDVRSDN